MLPSTPPSVDERPAHAGPAVPERLYPGLLLLGVVVGVVAFWFDALGFLRLLGFPVGELNNRWVLDDLVTLRVSAIATAAVLIVASAVLWKSPGTFHALSSSVLTVLQSVSRAPMFVPLVLGAVVLLKTVVQLGLYSVGYATYSADDFSRTLSADYWLQHLHFDFGAGAWAGMYDSAWLPLSDYVFGAGLAIHRDLYLTPKFVNLALSGALVVVSYLLGRELFGRRAGLVTAIIVAFQPWYVWIGFSGMTSDLPSAVLLGISAVFVVRWLRVERAGPLLAAAAALAAANGFRYENWLFPVTFSLLVTGVVISRWRQGGGGLVAGAGALLIANAVPIGWMTASKISVGAWLPALKVVNGYSDLAFSATTTAAPATTINIPLFVLGCFPFEVALSAIGMAIAFRSSRHRDIRRYVALPIATFILFATTFNWQVPAWLMIGRYFLTYVVLITPFAALTIVGLLQPAGDWRHLRFLGACLILVALATLNAGRISNYPAVFPQDALSVGWAVRGLQANATIPADAKILIERTPDWGDLGIIVLANRPERFAILGVPARASEGHALATASARAVDPLVLACKQDFSDPRCRVGMERTGFGLVILASEKHVRAFQASFPSPSWRIGRYHVFNLGAVPPGVTARAEPVP